MHIVVKGEEENEFPLLCGRTGYTKPNFLI